MQYQVPPYQVLVRSTHLSSTGDQLVLLENVTLVGLRHYTVAQKLKEVPVSINKIITRICACLGLRAQFKTLS